MIPEPFTELLHQIAEATPRGSRHIRDLRKDPEAHLLALLANMRNELMGDDKFSAMLLTTVEQSFFEDNVEEARRLLQRCKQP